MFAVDNFLLAGLVTGIMNRERYLLEMQYLTINYTIIACDGNSQDESGQMGVLVLACDRKVS